MHAVIAESFHLENNLVVTCFTIILKLVTPCFRVWQESCVLN